jgi:hypothetical protein
MRSFLNRILISEQFQVVEFRIIKRLDTIQNRTPTQQGQKKIEELTLMRVVVACNRDRDVRNSRTSGTDVLNVLSIFLLLRSTLKDPDTYRKSKSWSDWHTSFHSSVIYAIGFQRKKKQLAVSPRCYGYRSFLQSTCLLVSHSLTHCIRFQKCFAHLLFACYHPLHPRIHRLDVFDCTLQEGRTGNL